MSHEPYAAEARAPGTAAMDIYPSRPSLIAGSELRSRERRQVKTLLTGAHCRLIAQVQTPAFQGL
jgi:hypothetical protein